MIKLKDLVLDLDKGVVVLVEMEQHSLVQVVELTGLLLCPVILVVEGGADLSSEGSGGGSVSLTISGSTTIDGTISADGKTARAGGSGGGIYLTTATISGGGSISSSGGNSNTSSGAGGGGRIAIILTGANADFSSLDLASISAYGGFSGYKGAAGTIYIQDANDGANGGELIINNNNVATAAGTDTRISSFVTDTTVGSITLTASKAGKLTIDSGQTLTLQGTGTTLNAGVGTTLTNNGTLNLGGTAFTNNGTVDVDATTSTVNYTGQSDDGVVTLIPTTYYNLTTNNAGTTFSQGGATTVTNILTPVSGTYNLAGFNLLNSATFTMPSGTTFQLQGGETVSVAPTLAAGSTVRYTGTAGPYTLKDWTYHHLTIDGNGTTFSLGATESIAGDLTISTGTLSLAGYGLSATGAFHNLGTLKLRGDETVAITNFDSDSGTTLYVGDGDGSVDTFAIKDFPYSNLTISPTDSSDVFEIGSLTVLAVNGNLTIDTGTLNLSGTNLTLGSSCVFSNSGTLKLNGDEALTNFTNDTNSGTVEYVGTGTYNSLNAGNIYHDLTINGSGATYSPTSDLTARHLTLANGTLNLTGQDLTLSGNLMRTSGTLSGTTNQTLTLNGTNQGLNHGDVTWNTVSLTGSSGTVTLGSNFTVQNLLSIPSGRALSLVSYTVNVPGTLTNHGSINEGTGHIAHSSSDFAIADDTFNAAAFIFIPADKVYLTLIDSDANTDGANLNTVPVTVFCPNDSEAVTLTETGIATGIFRNGGVDTMTYAGSATENDGTLQCSDGDTITASYTDPQDSGDTEQATSSATTDTLPVAPSGLAGSSPTSSSITWTWTDNDHNERGFKLYSGTGTLITTIDSANTTSYTETGLTKGTSYTRKVVAFNNAGNSSFSGTAAVTTRAEPLAPSRLTGSALASTAITWTWQDNSDDETGFKLTDSDGFILKTINGANTTSYTETGLTKGTSYTRKVVAYNNDGNSRASNAATVKTKSDAPASPALKTPADNASLATLRPSFTFGIDPDADSGTTSYTLYIDGTDKAISFAPLLPLSEITVSGAKVSFGTETVTVTLLSDLAEGKHTWKVRAKDAADNTGDSELRSFTLDITKPTLPSVQPSPSLAATDTDLATGSTRPTFGLVLADTTALAKATVTIDKLSYFLGNEFSRETVFNQTFNLAGTNQTLSVSPANALAPGRYVLTVTVEDAAGNRTVTTKTLTVSSPADQKESILTPADFPKTATELKNLIEQGITPTKAPQAFWLPNLEKQAQIRQMIQAENLDAYLSRLLSSTFLARLNDRLAKVEQSLSAWAKGVTDRIGTRLASRFRKPVTASCDTHALAATVWPRFGEFLCAAERNRIELAIKSETGLNRFARPIVLTQERVVLVSRFATDVFSSRHGEQLAITDVVISEPGSRSVEISWKTNRSTSGKVNFGPTTMYGKNLFVNEYKRSHTVTLTDLAPNTRYYFEVLATDLEGKQTFDAYYSFTTFQE